jgi:serine/threonine-protein kinase HipA
MRAQYCLSCLKELEDKDLNGFHAHCATRLFSKNEIPVLDFTDKSLTGMALQSVGEGKTIAGVQKKLSLHLLQDPGKKGLRFTLVGYPLGFILKPPSPEYPNLTESEGLVMELAEEVGLSVVPHTLIRLSNGSLAYLTKRIDRVEKAKGEWHSIPMEDCCQLDQKPTAEKYHGSYERIGAILDDYSARPLFDKTELFVRLVFCFLSGNSDMHLKNFSLIRDDRLGTVLSAAYDLLPTNLLLPEDREETALSLHGKKKNLTRNDFLALADSYGIARATASQLIDRLLSFEPLFHERTAHSFMDEKGKRDFETLFEARFARLKRK